MYERASKVRRASVNALGGISAGILGGEAAGLVNLETNFVCGGQVAGIANVVGGPVVGGQVAGIANVSAGLTGAQAGLVNVDAGELEGAQVGLVELAAEGRGVQAGLVNGARADLSGAQVGLVNVTGGAVHGVQVGVVNYADDSDLSVGVVSIVRHGRTHIDTWVSDWKLLAAGVKHGGKHFYNVYGAGVRAGLGDGSTRAALVLGIGGHFDLSEHVWLDADGLGHLLLPTGDQKTMVNVGTARVALGLRLARQLSIFGGPTYNVAVARSREDADLSAFGTHALRDESGLSIRGWPGAVIGAEGL